MHFDQGIGVSDGSSIMRHEEWDSFGSSLDSSDTQQFVGGLFGSDLVQDKSTLDIIQ